MWISAETQRRDSRWWENRTQKQKLAWHKSFPAVNLVLKLLSESINTACVYNVCYSMRQYCSQSMWILLSTQKIDSECWENRLNDRKICLNTQKKQFGLEHYCQSLKYHVRGPKNYPKNNQFLGHLCIITLSFMICVRMFSAPTGNLPFAHWFHSWITPYQSYFIKLLVFVLV